MPLITRSFAEIFFSQMVTLYKDPHGEKVFSQHTQQHTNEHEQRISSLASGKEGTDSLQKRIVELENLVDQLVCLINLPHFQYFNCCVSDLRL